MTPAPWLRKLYRRWLPTTTWARKAGRSRPRIRPGIECLEDRVVPSVDVWVGGSKDSHDVSTGGDPTAWSNPLNWLGGVIPQAGDTVRFTNNVVETYTNASTGKTFTHN